MSMVHLVSAHRAQKEERRCPACGAVQLAPKAKSAQTLVCNKCSKPIPPRSRAK